MVLLLACVVMSCRADELEISGIAIEKSYNYRIRSENILESEACPPDGRRAHKVILKSEAARTVDDGEVTYDNVKLKARWEWEIRQLIKGSTYGEIEFRNEEVSDLRYTQLGTGYMRQLVENLTGEIGYANRFVKGKSSESYLNLGLSYIQPFFGFEVGDKFNYLHSLGGDKNRIHNEITLTRALKGNLYLRLGYLYEQDEPLDHKEARVSVVWKY